jgi:hypothetical protein
MLNISSNSSPVNITVAVADSKKLHQVRCREEALNVRKSAVSNSSRDVQHIFRSYADTINPFLQFSLTLSKTTSKRTQYYEGGEKVGVIEEGSKGTYISPSQPLHHSIAVIKDTGIGAINPLNREPKPRRLQIARLLQRHSNRNKADRMDRL